MPAIGLRIDALGRISKPVRFYSNSQMNFQ